MNPSFDKCYFTEGVNDIAFLVASKRFVRIGSTWFVRFLNGELHVAGDGACFGCDRLASCGTTELRKAEELPRLSERHFRRLWDAYEDRGEEGLVDRRRDRSEFVSGSRRGGGVVGEAFRTRYFGFRVKRFPRADRGTGNDAPACSRDTYHGPVAWGATTPR